MKCLKLNMPKRENRSPVEAGEIESQDAAAAVAASIPAAVHTHADVSPVVSVDVSAASSGASGVPAPAAVPSEEFKSLVDLQRQQIEALTSMVRELQNRIVASPPPPPPPPAVPVAAAPAPVPTPRARVLTNVRNPRRRAPSSSASSSAFGSSVPQLPNQAALGGGDGDSVPAYAARRAARVQPEQREQGDTGLTYKLRRETRGSSGRRVWDHKSNTPRSQSDAGVFAARDEIRTGSSYVVRGFSGMI